ncbi:hypothetical protein DH2020_005837 [Rehmannia glutinosa]|uniref:Methyltransferase n=1 Tax=Rehmannia glutinosa TaxID=99300 RepID=A0ABR0XH47_REHGL
MGELEEGIHAHGNRQKTSLLMRLINRLVKIHVNACRELFGTMKHKDGKPISHPDKNSRTVPMAIMFLVLCGFSFYLGGIFCSEKDKYVTQEVNKEVEPSKETAGGPLQIKAVTFPECSADLQDYTPCTDPKKEGEKFLFPGGGTMFPNGVSKYVDLMQDLIPGMKDGTIRTAIDTGCGVASWGGDLLDRGILTVSLAPRDNHEAQVQFALERGIPAILGIISTQRLPFPSNSFDMAHCSRCLIPWTEFGGIYLLEVHRILRPGGFWVLSGPPVNYENRWRGWNTTIEEQRSDYEKLQELLTSMCFKLYNKKDDIAVWQKLSDSSCYKKLEAPDTYPPKCDDGTEPDSAWYTPIRPCVVAPNQKYKKLALKSLAKWPERLNTAPERVADVRGGSDGAFKHDDSKWKTRVKHYKKLVPSIGTNKIRNVMDMNTLYGGFAAALIDYPLWVMNVVSSYSPNTLAVVYDRGLIGTYHDW